MLGKALNAPQFSAEVRRVDFSGLDLGRIRLGPEAGLAIDAIQMDWSVAGLLQARIETVRVLGLRVVARETDGVWNVPGILNAAGNGEPSSGPAIVPEIGEFHMDGSIELEGHAINLKAPWSATGSLDGTGLLRMDMRCTLTGRFPGLPMDGTIAAHAEFSIPSGHTPRITAQLTFDSFQTMFANVQLAQDGNASLNVSGMDSLLVQTDPIRFRSPLPVTIWLNEIGMDLDSGRATCSWVAGVESLPGFTLSSGLRLSGHSEAQRQSEGWTIRTAAELAQAQAVPEDAPDVTLSLTPCAMRLDVSTNSSGMRLNGGLALGTLRMEHKERTLLLSGMNATCSAEATSRPLAGTINLADGRLEARQGDMSLTSTRLDGHLGFDLGERLTLRGAVNVNAQAKIPGTTALMRCNLPLSWPDPASSPGQISAELSTKAGKIAAFASTIQQNSDGFGMNGTLATLPVPIHAAVTGHLNPYAPRTSWMRLQTHQTLTLPGDLTRFSPAMKTLSGSARLDANASLDLHSGTPKIPISLKLTGLDLNHAQTSTTLTGGAITLAFPDLLVMRSDSDQHISFDRLQLGSIGLNNGDIRFQVEAPHSILVEGCRIQWAGGHIGTQAFRVNPGIEDYTIDFYCDQVELAQALRQFGMPQAQGGGTANGRIPAHYRDGSLTIDRGFLYSTPGEKGILHISGTDILTRGVPADSPQFAQLDLASEALKDFAYDWAKLNMNTQGKELVVSLEMDGKPINPLPFTYNHDIGSFVRVSASSPGSVFQGFRLDATFRLPLDQLLHYRKLLELMKNGG